MPKRKCDKCGDYKERGHNYCRMCGFHVRKGHVNNCRIATAYSTREKYCGCCSEERDKCKCR